METQSYKLGEWGVRGVISEVEGVGGIRRREGRRKGRKREGRIELEISPLPSPCSLFNFFLFPCCSLLAFPNYLLQSFLVFSLPVPIFRCLISILTLSSSIFLHLSFPLTPCPPLPLPRLPLTCLVTNAKIRCISRRIRRQYEAFSRPIRRSFLTRCRNVIGWTDEQERCKLFFH